MIIEGIKIRGITCNSKKVKKDYAFVAIIGEKADGNLYIDEAIKKGAAIIYTEKEIQTKNCLVKVVDNTRKELAELCNAFYGYPSEKMKIIGVTGTNGKTTTSSLIHHILNSHGVAAGLIGTLSIKIGEKEYPSYLTTPSAEDIYYYLHKMEKQGIEVVIMEVSSHGLKNERVHGIKFDMAVHTNIDRDHLNFHGSFSNYVAAKKKLFDSLLPGKIALINHDDLQGLKLLEGNNHIVVVTYGLNLKATVTASSIDIDFSTSFNYCLQRGITTSSGLEIEVFEHPISLNLLGKHNVYNALAAITSCLLLDIPIESIAKATKQFPMVQRRMEIIFQGEYTVIDDFCHNPSNYEAVFQSIQNLQYKNLHIINSIRGNRGKEINEENMEIVKQWHEVLKIKNLILTSSVECVGINDQVSEIEREAVFDILKKSNIPFIYEARLKDAINRALKEVGKGDILLLMGAQGMNQGKEILMELLADQRGLSHFFVDENKINLYKD